MYVTYMLVFDIQMSVAAIVSGSWYGVDLYRDWCEEECHRELAPRELDCASKALKASVSVYCYQEGYCYFPDATAPYMIGNQQEEGGYECRRLGNREYC